MLKVFLVEDESIVREGLRDNIPWNQYGYEFAGEASDGEIALLQICKLRPDVLITDIKMPFMDGLELSKAVIREFPDIKIIIISGYDDFDYARQAIQIGVEQYLLKPVTRSALQKALLEVGEKIEYEREQKNYLQKFQTEMREYEQFSRRRFFEKVFGGSLNTQEINQGARKLSLDLTASCYNLVMVSLREKGSGENNVDSKILIRCQEEVLLYFVGEPEYFIFQWDISVYIILIVGEKEQMEELRYSCIENLTRICGGYPGGLDWYAAAGNAVEGISMLPEVYEKVNHLLSYRFLLHGQHILTEADLDVLPGGEDRDIKCLDFTKVEPKLIQSFLHEGKKDEVKDIVKVYVQSLAEPLKSRMFRDFFILNAHFTTIAFVERLGYEQEEFLSLLPGNKLNEVVMNIDNITVYIEILFTQAIGLRDQESESQGKKTIQKALEYIEQNFTKDFFSLNAAADAVHVSPNYLSSLFSQKMQTTFVEYVTKMRMEKAKNLLRLTDRVIPDIAGEAGYKDAYYFSFVFKRTQGCTPREYRNRFRK